MSYKLNILSEDELQMIYEKLILLAIQRKTITYGNLLNELDLTRIKTNNSHFHSDLGTLNRILCEKDEDFPLISILIVRKDTGKPGDGFKKLAIEMGKYDKSFGFKKFLNYQKIKVFEYASNNKFPEFLFR